MRKAISTLGAVVLLMAVSLSTAYANDVSTLDRIDLDVTINENGDAHIVENWNANVTAGSEASKSLIHLNGSKVSDFTVHNESGKEYKFTQPWDSTKNRLDK